MASWLNPMDYGLVQAAYSWLYPPPILSPEIPTRPWCELHVITTRELKYGEDEYTEIVPLFQPYTSITVKAIADDGNCLFSALAAFLSKDPAAVRAEVVGYLREHQADEFVRETIPQAIEEHNARCCAQKDTQTADLMRLLQDNHITVEEFEASCSKLDDEIEVKKVAGGDMEAYFGHVAQDRFFGGPLEIYAAAHFYDISICVYQAHGNKYNPTFICASSQAEKNGQCSLHYNSDSQHYNLITSGSCE